MKLVSFTVDIEAGQEEGALAALLPPADRDVLASGMKAFGPHLGPDNQRDPARLLAAVERLCEIAESPTRPLLYQRESLPVWARSSDDSEVQAKLYDELLDSLDLIAEVCHTAMSRGVKVYWGAHDDL